MSKKLHMIFATVLTFMTLGLITLNTVSCGRQVENPIMMDKYSHATSLSFDFRIIINGSPFNAPSIGGNVFWAQTHFPLTLFSPNLFLFIMRPKQQGSPIML